MSIYRKKLSSEAKEFISFLEQSVFHHPITHVRQFAHGSASENYLITQNNQKIIVKLTHSYNKAGIQRLTRICSALSQNVDLAGARLIPVGKKLYFQYKNRYGMMIEYCEGAALPSYEMGKRHFQQILSGYTHFKKTKWLRSADFLPLYDMPQVLARHLTFIENTLKKAKTFSPIKRRIWTMLCLKHKQFLEHLKQTPLTLPPEKLTVIHGDFHNNNLLFNKEKLLAFLDFEEVGYGYEIEDIMRFILCLVQRLPFFVSPYTYIDEWMRCAIKRFHFSKQEWIIGLNSYYLQRADKAFQKKDKIGSRKQLIRFIKLAFFIKKYQKITQLIQQLPD